MKIVLTCGHPISGYEMVHRVLIDSGLEDARPSRREGFLPNEIQNKLCLAHDIPAIGVVAIQQIHPGKVWENLAVDLFVSNLEQEHWGWADPNTVYLLDFWHEFDPQTRFVFTYNSPANALARLGDVPEGEINDAVRNLLGSWHVFNDALLRYYNRHRDRCLLISVDAVERLDGQEKLLPLLRDQRGLSLKTQVVQAVPTQAPRSAILGLVASQILEEMPEIQALYEELESSADIYSGESETRKILAEMAMAEYQRMASSISAGQRALETFAGQIAATEEQLAERERELAQAKTCLADLENAKKHEQSQDTELEQENELLLLQLHQVQEELEHYFLKYQEVTAGKRVLVNVTKVATCMSVAIDMKGKFEGENWYPAEADGCWAGPEKRSTLTVPALAPGEYRIELDIVDAMNPGIAQNMALSFNGRKLFLQGPGQASGTAILANLFSNKKRYPLALHANFRVEEADVGQAGTLEFNFPQLVSPAERGSDDRRHLAIRLGAVRILALPGESASGVDLRDQIQGDNWYEPEADGRWAGPEKRSRLQLVVPRPGSHRLAIEVVDAMSQEIIGGMQCRLAGKPLTMTEDDPWADWARKLGQKKNYPRTLQAEVEILPEQAGRSLELELLFPGVISPASRGSADQRQLTVRIKSVVLHPANCH
jgi:hypothetical protein